jgi:rhodanese-related sulfurtransferase
MKRDSVWRDTIVILVLAGIAAAVSNALAGPERKLYWVGTYAAVSAPAAPAALTPSPVAAVTAASTTTGGRDFPPHPNTAWVEITGDDVAALHSRGDVLILDARRTSVYRAGHIAGARSIAIWEADADDKVKALFAEGRDQSAPVVIYCSGGDCEDSHMLSEKLYKVGFDNVLVYKDGFPDWQKRKLPISKGDMP